MKDRLQKLLDRLQYTITPSVQITLSDENCIDVAVFDAQMNINWDDKIFHPKKTTPFQDIGEAIDFANKELDKILDEDST